MEHEEKEKYYEMFREDTKRYQMAMQDYKPSAQFLEKKRLAKLKTSTLSNHGISTDTVPQMVKSYFGYVAGSWAAVAASLPGLEPDQVQEEILRRWCEGEPGGSEGQGWDENKNVVAKKTKKRNRKKKIDPDTPRAPQLAYQLFLNTLKEELMKQMPDLTYTDMVRHVVAKWKVLTEEQKEPFFELERAEKERYERELGEKVKNKPEIEAPIKDLKEPAKGSPCVVNEMKPEELNDKVEIVKGMEDESSLLDDSNEIEDDKKKSSIATRIHFSSNEEDSSEIEN